MVKITAVRLGGDSRIFSMIALASPPSWKSTITASNFRRFNKPSAVGTSKHTSGDMASCCIDALSCSMLAASLDTPSALPIDTEGAGADAFALLMPSNLLVAAIHVWHVNAKPYGRWLALICCPALTCWRWLTRLSRLESDLLNCCLTFSLISRRRRPHLLSRAWLHWPEISRLVR